MARSIHGYSIPRRNNPHVWGTVAYYNREVTHQLNRLKWWKQWVWVSALEGRESRFGDDLATYAGVYASYQEALANLRKATQSEVEPAAA